MNGIEPYQTLLRRPTKRRQWQRFGLLLAFAISSLPAADAAEATAATNSVAAKEPKAEPPQPPVINPGLPGGPPSDALVLFDGRDLSQWRDARTNAAAWKVENGYLEVARTGDIFTREEFGDVQLHVEWAAPAEVTSKDQGRGNSGVYLMGRYEIQVLDGFENQTYPAGQAAAFYGNSAPLVNACRPPGEWQTYDIIFRAPKPQADGQIEPGSLTLLHNGVLVQDHVPVKGPPTPAAAFKGVAAKGPLVLQDHGNPVRYRNIWLRKL